jgi:hypothetical protein
LKEKAEDKCIKKEVKMFKPSAAVVVATVVTAKYVR